MIRLNFGGAGLDLDSFEFVRLAGGPSLLGDINLDGSVNFLDISPLIAFLSSGESQAEADCNQDGFVNFSDIAPFIAILSGG